MFLSRVEIPWDAARNAYNFHRRLWKLFPGTARESRKHWDEPRQGFLFRIEEHRPGQAACLLVQSDRRPEATAGLAVLGVREFHPSPQPGQRLAFLLTANPVKTILDGEKNSKPGKRSDKCRVPLIRDEGQREWLARKLDGAARVEAASVLAHPPLYFRKAGAAGKLLTATFEGMLCVADPEALRQLLKKGIGPAKAFGCVLLLVRRP
jgi:CRISPR system Cascade subunit CasE